MSQPNNPLPDEEIITRLLIYLAAHYDTPAPLPDNFSNLLGIPLGMTWPEFIKYYRNINTILRNAQRMILAWHKIKKNWFGVLLVLLRLRR